MPQLFRSFFQNFGIWIQALRLWDTCQHRLFFQICWKTRREDSRLIWPLAWFFDSTQDSGLLHMECEFNRTPCKRILENYSGYKHLTASMQPRKYSEDTFKMKFGRPQRRLQKYSEVYNTRLRRARGLIRPGTMGLCTSYRFPRIVDGAWPTRYTICIYSYISRTSWNRRKLLE
jgi:hypothetical protein